jgi:predicted dehydrogenase
MTTREIGLGIIGGGLMGREVASAVARWFHLLDLDFAPRITAVCDVNPKATHWFAQHVPTIDLATDDYRRLLADDGVEAVYCAVPHHLHQQVYTAVIRSGKHLLGEKPFGIDLAANTAILDAVRANPKVLARCSSEYPFFPGVCRIARWVREGRFGRLIEVEAGFWHSSDLDPRKPINWKRRIAENGAYGCLGDLGMHVVHLPFRFGWRPRNVRALLSKIVAERPDPATGKMVPCETWDNAILACEVQDFPMLLSTKRIAPGHGNTWFIRVLGTDFSAEFSTRNPKEVRFLDYTPGAEQTWQSLDLPHESVYRSITGGIFEFGFSDSILQMLAAFLDEMVHGAAMLAGDRRFICATPDEAALSHRLFTAALESQSTGQTVAMPPGD